MTDRQVRTVTDQDPFAPATSPFVAEVRGDGRQALSGIQPARDDRRGFSNAVVTVDSLPAVAEEDFLPVERAQLGAELGLVGVAGGAVLVVAAAVLVAVTPPQWVVLLTIVVWSLLCAGSVAVTVAAFTHQGWLLRDHDLSHRRGVIVRRQVTVPFNRVQHTSVAAGPLDRLLGLAKLQVFTASGGSADLIISGLRAEDAARLRERVVAAVDRS